MKKKKKESRRKKLIGASFGSGAPRTLPPYRRSLLIAAWMRVVFFFLYGVGVDSSHAAFANEIIAKLTVIVFQEYTAVLVFTKDKAVLIPDSSNSKIFSNS